MRRGRKFPSDLRSPSTFHRCYTGRIPSWPFRKNYMKGGLIGTYVYLAFKSLSGKSRHQGLLTHDQEGSFTTETGKRLPQRSPAPLAMPLASMLVTICLLLWMVQNAIKAHKSDSLVGGNSKRMTLAPLSSSCVGSDSRRVISPSLTTPNFSVRRRMLPSPPSKAAFPWHCQRHSLRHTGTLLVLPMRKHEKNRKILEAASLLSEMRPGLFLVIDIMLFGSDIYSLFPLYNTMAILVITYVILFLPYTAEYVISS